METLGDELAVFKGGDGSEPSTLNPQPCTLHPTPQTLNPEAQPPTPKTLHP